MNYPNGTMNLSWIAITITMMVSIMVISGNQHAIYAERDDDKELSEYDVDVLCDASEDYEANKEQCDKLYDMVEDDEDDD